MKANLVIDTKGLSCPLPIIKASDAIRSVAEGTVIEVISDDPAIELDLPAWCQSQGHTIESASSAGDVFRYLVRKRATGEGR